MPQRNPNAAPAIDSPLLDWLDKLYPERCPDIGQSDREIWVNVGARQVVRRLRLELQRQEENIRNVQTP